MDRDIVFVGQILDNVHGFIPFTETEKKIMNTQLFKRLQSIKQLSVVNWIFPGSEHTRFIHSLGVMHLADKIAISLNLSLEERRTLRLAGLLHDIGHYPLSHVCEAPYKKPMFLEDLSDSDLCKNINSNVCGEINTFSVGGKTTLMSKSDGRHHEVIGSLIVRNNPEIRQLVIDECQNEHAPEIISDIIIGNVERAETDPLLVQIIHSELDADGIDYLMRDSTFSGTSFGSFEIDQLIRCLSVGYVGDKRILCITPKGIAAADQYLINKFFAYSQIVFNRHIVISEWMAECVIDWMQKNNYLFPNGSALEHWVKHSNQDFLYFTDNMFWTSLDRIKQDKSYITPHYVKVLCKHLLDHDEPIFIRDSEIKFITNDDEEAKDLLQKADIFKDIQLHDHRITLLSTRRMTKQLPLKEFRAKLAQNNAHGTDAKISTQGPDPELSRLMECICVKEADGSLHLLCDDPRSLMRTMYNSTLVFLRSYEFPNE